MRLVTHNTYLNSRLAGNTIVFPEQGLGISPRAEDARCGSERPVPLLKTSISAPRIEDPGEVHLAPGGGRCSIDQIPHRKSTVD